MKLRTTREDDQNFVRIIASIIDSFVAERKPEVVALIQIDNWFGHQWLHFAGKLLGALGVWRKELTVPPFNPNRVKNQAVYILTEGKRYQKVEVPPIHVVQPSGENLNRKLSQTAESLYLAWWSSNTVANGKGSLMVYSQINGESSAWFVSFERDTEWKINKTKGIPVKVVEHLTSRGVKTIRRRRQVGI